MILNKFYLNRLEATKVHARDRFRQGTDFLVRVCHATMESAQVKRDEVLKFKANVEKSCQKLKDGVANKW